MHSPEGISRHGPPEELRPGLWAWAAPHPDWAPDQDWPQRVNCFAYAPAGGLLLIDPLVEGDEWGAIDALAERAGGVAAVAVTVGFHERQAGEAARRYGAKLFAPPSRKAREALAGARTVTDGDRLAGGVQAIHVPIAEEALLYLPDTRTLVAGDILLAREGRLSLCPASWLDNPEDLGVLRDQVGRALELPLEAVAVSHGEPPLFQGRAALEQALRP